MKNEQQAGEPVNASESAKQLAYTLREYAPSRIGLAIYGSVARQQIWSGSNIDVIVVVPDDPKKSYPRIQQIHVGGSIAKLENIPLSAFRSVELYPPSISTERFFGSVADAHLIEDASGQLERFQAMVRTYPDALAGGIGLIHCAKASRAARVTRKFLKLGSIGDATAHFTSIPFHYAHLRFAQSKVYAGKDWFSQLKQLDGAAAELITDSYRSSFQYDRLALHLGELEDRIDSHIKNAVKPLWSSLSGGVRFSEIATHAPFVDRYDLECLTLYLRHRGYLEIRGDVITWLE